MVLAEANIFRQGAGHSLIPALAPGQNANAAMDDGLKASFHAPEDTLHAEFAPQEEVAGMARSLEIERANWPSLSFFLKLSELECICNYSSQNNKSVEPEYSGLFGWWVELQFSSA